MKNITLSITDLQHRRLHIWAAQRDCSASAIVRWVIQDLPKLSRAIHAIAVYDLAVMGIHPAPEDQALVDLLKPIPRNKKSAQISPAKQNRQKQPALQQALTFNTTATENNAIACGTVQQTTRQPTRISHRPALTTHPQGVSLETVLKGHDFSRAAKSRESVGLQSSRKN
jgi:hypothetical protein